MKYYLLIIIGAFLITYLAGAFIGWEFNPGKWGNAERFLCVFFSLIWSMGGSLLFYHWEDENKKP